MYDQYAYDELGQLIREDNKDANKSYTYTYDSRGNILEKKTYAFTLGTLGTAQKTDSYGYATDSWKDRLTSYNGQTITYDAIGNPLTYNRQNQRKYHIQLQMERKRPVVLYGLRHKLCMVLL